MDSFLCAAATVVREGRKKVSWAEQPYVGSMAASGVEVAVAVGAFNNSSHYAHLV